MGYGHEDLTEVKKLRKGEFRRRNRQKHLRRNHSTNPTKKQADFDLEQLEEQLQNKKDQYYQDMEQIKPLNQDLPYKTPGPTPQLNLFDRRSSNPFDEILSFRGKKDQENGQNGRIRAQSNLTELNSIKNSNPFAEPEDIPKPKRPSPEVLQKSKSPKKVNMEEDPELYKKGQGRYKGFGFNADGAVQDEDEDEESEDFEDKAIRFLTKVFGPPSDYDALRLHGGMPGFSETRVRGLHRMGYDPEVKMYYGENKEHVRQLRNYMSQKLEEAKDEDEESNLSTDRAGNDPLLTDRSGSGTQRVIRANPDFYKPKVNPFKKGRMGGRMPKKTSEGGSDQVRRYYNRGKVSKGGSKGLNTNELRFNM